MSDRPPPAAIDTILKNMYAPVMSEQLGVPVTVEEGVSDEEGFRWTFHAGEKTAVLLIEHGVMTRTKTEAGWFARMLDIEMKALVKELK